MIKRITSLFLAVVMMLGMPSIHALAATATPRAAYFTESRFGLTVVQTSGGKQGFTTGINIRDGFVDIFAPGDYTISGTADGTVAGDLAKYIAEWTNANTTAMRGVVDVRNGISGTVNLTFDNLSIKTGNWLAPPVAISKYPQGAENSPKININLTGTNRIISTSSTAAIVKQGSSDTLSFSGNGTLIAESKDVVIGSSALAFSSSNVISPNCSNIIFNQTGKISLTSSTTGSALIGTSGVKDTSARSRYTNNIQINRGILELNNTAVIEGASLIGGGYGGVVDGIGLNGGTIMHTGAAADYLIGPGKTFSDGYQNSKNIVIKGGSILTTIPLRYPTNDEGKKVYRALIKDLAKDSDISSIAIIVDGNPYPYNPTGLHTDNNGELGLYLPATGTAAVRIAGVIYGGAVVQDGSILTVHQPVTSITDLPTAATVNNTLSLPTLSGIQPSDATSKQIAYKMINPGTTGATLKDNKFTPTAPGTAIVEAVVYNGKGFWQDYVQRFEIDVTHKPATDINYLLDDSMPIYSYFTPSGATVPSDASVQNIVWTIASNGGTSAVIDKNGVVKANASGVLVLRATLPKGGADGADFVKDFAIKISYTPVNTILNNFPLEMLGGTSLDLSQYVVMPANATFSKVKWSVWNETTTVRAVITDNKLTIDQNMTGTTQKVTVRATVNDGKIGTGDLASQDYTQNFDIMVPSSNGPVVDISQGSINIKGNGNGTNTIYYADEFNNPVSGKEQHTISEDVVITVTGTVNNGFSGKWPRPRNTLWLDGAKATVVLKDLSITNTQANLGSPIELKNNAKATLITQGTVTLKVVVDNAAAINVPMGNTLVLNGDEASSLNLAMNSTAAAIGGNGGGSSEGESIHGQDSGSITINYANITATNTFRESMTVIGGGSGYGAGNGGNGSAVMHVVTLNTQMSIGGGSSGFNGGKAGDGYVDIYGGNITCGTLGAGELSHITSKAGGGRVTVYGGTINATSPSAFNAAVGNGAEVIIHGGDITAKDNGNTVSKGAAIGGGYCTDGIVTINGGTVVAKSNGGGAAIGGGSNNVDNLTRGGVGKVAIKGGKVTATAYRAVAIGNGNNSNGTPISDGFVRITSGEVTAESTYELGPDKTTLGNGDNSQCAEVSISGGIVNVKNQSIYSHNFINAKVVNISGGTLGFNKVYKNAGAPSQHIASESLSLTGGSFSLIDFKGDNLSALVTTPKLSTLATPLARVSVDLIDMNGAHRQPIITDITVDGTLQNYGFNGVQTDAKGKLYMYLPLGNITASVNQMPYAGKSKADGSGELVPLPVLSAKELGGQTGKGATLALTATVNGTAYGVLTKRGSSTTYATVADLKAAATKASVIITDNAANLTLTGQEGEYTLYLGMESDKADSVVQALPVILEGRAVPTSDVIISYQGEWIAAKDFLPYSLEVAPNAIGPWQALTTKEMYIQDWIGTTIYIRKLYTDKSIGTELLPLVLPARRAAPTSSGYTSTINSITVTNPVPGAQYSLYSDFRIVTDGTKPFTSAINYGKYYNIYARFANTSSEFASERLEINTETPKRIEFIPSGSGEKIEGNSITGSQQETAEVGDVITITITQNPINKALKFSILGHNGVTSFVDFTDKLTKVEENKWQYVYTVSAADNSNIIFKASFTAPMQLSISHPDPVTIFADNKLNISGAKLEEYLYKNEKVTATYEGGHTLQIQVPYTLKTGTWAATGGDYVFEATSWSSEYNNTCDVTMNVLPITATPDTIPAKDKLVVVDGYTTHEQLGLPKELRVTYTATGYTTHSEVLPVVWSTAVPKDFGKTVATQSFSGKVTLPAWATGTGEVTASVNITDKSPISNKLSVAMAGWTYGDSASVPQGSKTDNSITIDTDKFVYSYAGTANDGTSYSDTVAPTKAGSYVVTATYGDDTQAGTATANFIVAKRALTASLSVTGVSKVYDTNTTIVGTQPTVVMEGKLGADTLAYTTSFAYADALVGNDKTINAVIDFSSIDNTNKNYSLTSANLSAAGAVIERMASPSAPGAPVLTSKTFNTVILVASAGYEYSKDGTAWQPSSTFDGLSSKTVYSFYQRIAETDTVKASANSPVLEVTTEEAPLTTINISLTLESWTYGDVANTPQATAVDAGVHLDPDKLSYSYAGTANDGTSYSDTVAPTKSGSYVVTATYGDDTQTGTATANFTVAKRALTASLSVVGVSKVYDTTTTIVGTQPTVVMEGKLAADTLAYTTSFAYADALVGNDKTINAVIDFSSIDNTNKNYSLTSANLSASGAEIERMAGPSAPGAPVLTSKTFNTVILVASAGYEYSKDGTAWQSGNEFGSLIPKTEYSFYQRIAETDTMDASASSVALVEMTESAPLVTIDIDLAIASYSYGDVANNPVVTPRDEGVVLDVSKLIYSYSGTAKDGTLHSGDMPPVKAGSYTVAVTYTDESQTGSSTANFEVTPRLLTATLSTTGVSKVYDTNTTIVGTQPTVILSNAANGESPLYTAYFAYGDALPSQNKTIHATITLNNDAVNLNYALANSNVIGTGGVIERLAGPSAPTDAPTLASKTHSTVTLVSVAGYDYSSDGVHWQQSNLFTNLSALTEYSFYQRVAQTAINNPSSSSPSIKVTTDKAPAQPDASTPDPTQPQLPSEGESGKDKEDNISRPTPTPEQDLTVPSIDPPDPLVPIDVTQDLVLKFDCDYNKLDVVYFNDLKLTRTLLNDTTSQLSGWPGYEGVLGLASDGVWITLKKEWLQTLVDGKMEVRVSFIDGNLTKIGTTTLTIKQQKTPMSNPPKEDLPLIVPEQNNSNTGVWTGLALIVLSGIAAFAWWKFKNKTKK